MSRSTLRLHDGRELILRERTSGGSKNETRYAVLDGGQQVVVKIKTTHGHLSVERSALTFAQEHDVSVPSLPTGSASYAVPAGHGRLVVCAQP